MEEENNEKIFVEKQEIKDDVNSLETSYLLNIDRELKREAKIICAMLGLSMKDLFIKAIEEYVSKQQELLEKKDNFEKSEKDEKNAEKDQNLEKSEKNDTTDF